MTIGRTFRFPAEQLEQREKAKKLAWLSIGLLTSGAIAIAVTVGQSQAMKTAWVSDILTAIPPMALLVALRYELREPTKRFPYGYFRSISIAFLVTACVLTVVGLYLFADSSMKLIRQERPPIGTVTILGRQIWAGWTMVAALTYSMSIGMLLGRLKKPVAEKLHDKELEAETQMNKAEWMSEGAAIVGIILVGYGHWWGDAAAAAFISIEIVRDGWINIRQVVGDLMDESPSVLGKSDLEHLPVKVRDAAERLGWVERAAVRLREQGHVITGDVFVVPRADMTEDAGGLVARVEDAANSLSELDWRLHGLTVMPVSQLDGQDPPRLAPAPRPTFVEQGA
jgi:cation diffusion facilitator family transporter